MSDDSELQKWFSEVDKDESGLLESIELQQALKQATLHFTQMSTNMMLKLFDEDQQGKLSFEQFKKLYSWILEKIDAFVVHDEDNSGALDLDNGEVLQAVISAGMEIFF